MKDTSVRFRVDLAKAPYTERSKTGQLFYYASHVTEDSPPTWSIRDLSGKVFVRDAPRRLGGSPGDLFNGPLHFYFQTRAEAEAFARKQAER